MFSFKRRFGRHAEDELAEEMEAPPPITTRYLISAAGVPNFGDEFITRCWLRYLRLVEPDSQVWLDCIFPGRAAHLFAGEHPHLHCTSTAWQLVWRAQELCGPHGTYADGARLVDDWVLRLGSPCDDLGICAMREADSIHVLGGGYIANDWAFHALLLRIARRAKEFKGDMQLMATGLGLSPQSEDSASDVAESLLLFDSAGARDALSANRFNVGLDDDDAFLSLMLPQEVRQQEVGQEIPDPARLFVCLQEDVVGRHPEAVSLALETLLASGARQDEPLTLVECVPPHDAWSLELLKDQWKGEVRLLPFIELWQGGLPTPSDALWVTSRFHVHLLGSCAGARGASVEFGNEYYDIKHGSLRALGTGWSALVGTGEGAGATHCSLSEGFAAKAQEVAARKLEEANVIYGHKA